MASQPASHSFHFSLYFQYVEYYIDKGVLGVNKNLSYPVLEHRSPRIAAYSQGKYDSTLEQSIRLPVVPPTFIGVCRLIQIYYVLKVCLELEKTGDDLIMDFPFTVATVPFRIPNSPETPTVEYGRTVVIDIYLLMMMVRSLITLKNSARVTWKVACIYRQSFNWVKSMTELPSMMKMFYSTGLSTFACLSQSRKKICPTLSHSKTCLVEVNHNSQSLPVEGPRWSALLVVLNSNWTRMPLVVRRQVKRTC